MNMPLSAACQTTSACGRDRLGRYVFSESRLPHPSSLPFRLALTDSDNFFRGGFFLVEYNNYQPVSYG